MKIIEEEFVHYPSGVLRDRSVDLGSNSTHIKNKAFALYDSYEYASAAGLLESTYLMENDTISLFFAGISWLKSGDIQKGKNILFMTELDSLNDVNHIRKLVNNIKSKLK